MGFEYPDAKWAEVLSRIASGQSVTEAAHAVGVARGSVYVRARNNSDFRDKFDAVRNSIPVMRNHSVEMFLRNEKGELVLDGRFEPIPLSRAQFLKVHAGRARRPNR